eukprot:11038-Heterococcus_DN1.PRE.1
MVSVCTLAQSAAVAAVSAAGTSSSSSTALAQQQCKQHLASRSVRSGRAGSQLSMFTFRSKGCTSRAVGARAHQ